MARETKLQRQEREEAEKMEACKAYQAAYPSRLMEALGKASGFGWDIYVDGGDFLINIPYGSFRIPYAVGLEGWHFIFENFITAIDEEEKKRVEEKRIEGIKKAALGKLSEEEREALGV